MLDVSHLMGVVKYEPAELVLTAKPGASLASIKAELQAKRQTLVTMLLSLAFLGRDLVTAIVDNRLPRGLSLTDLMDLPSVCGEQWKDLGYRPEPKV